MAKPKSKPARSPHLDALAKTRGEIRALSAGIESHLNLHAATWDFAGRAADARRLARLFAECEALQAMHNEWERERDGAPPLPKTRGHWTVLRNGTEPVDYGTSFDDGSRRMMAAADTAEQILRVRYGKARIIRRSANAASVYVDVLTEDQQSILQREWFELQDTSK